MPKGVFLRTPEMLEHYSAGHKRHGMSNTKTWLAWKNMRTRCFYEKDKYYAEYGGRGITVCDRWNPTQGGSFENFLEDMGECPEDRSLDRVNVDGDYEPGNCRWATISEQNSDKRLKTHCRKGHAISVSSSGVRVCVECRRRRTRKNPDAPIPKGQYERTPEIRLKNSLSKKQETRTVWMDLGADS